MTEDTEVAVSRMIAAPASVLYDMVSDITRMGEWSPETFRARWLKGATGPAVGATFSGGNRRGFRRWSTTCTVTAATPGERFAFDVRFGPIRVANWAYDFVALSDTSTQVMESWTDHRSKWFAQVGHLATGVKDRPGANRASMEATLEALDRAATTA